ncbi:hypothetical protein GCM10022199_21840 [Marihabitans asiaticum]|uniref:Uncharacterized protein n=1 Tax=Marihabitans asiaticum TaxID=415218 RepID=A0A560WAL6_9MICO|nr:hypothetical protein FB557_2004 [Marihabitans asiaticum]
MLLAAAGCTGSEEPTDESSSTHVSVHELDGARVDLLAADVPIAELPETTDREASGLPPTLGIEPGQDLPGLAATDQPVRAVMLRQAETSARVHLVLYLPGAEEEYVEVDRELHGRLQDGPEPLTPQSSWISRDGHQVVVPQPGAVVVVDVAGGSVSEVAIPDETVAQAGWTASGDLLAQGRTAAWRVSDGTATRDHGSTATTSRRLITSSPGHLSMASYDEDGGIAGDRGPMPGPVNSVLGPTAVSPQGRAAAAVSLLPPVAADLGADEAIYISAPDATDDARILAFERGEGSFSGPQPSGWSGERVLLSSTFTQTQPWILEYDPAEGAVARVAELTGYVGGPRPKPGELVLHPALASPWPAVGAD